MNVAINGYKLHQVQMVQDVSIHVNEKDIGQFVVIDFGYPSLDYDRDIVSITLQRVDQENAQTQGV